MLCEKCNHHNPDENNFCGNCGASLPRSKGITLKDLPDVEMLKKCGISVAVANAFPEVKAICRYETLSNDRDGVAVVLEQVFGF